MALTEPGGKRGVGGFVRMSASLRSPILSPNGEVRVSEERDLVVGPWPDISPPRETSSTTTSKISEGPDNCKSDVSPAPINTPKSAATGTATEELSPGTASDKSSKAVDFSILSEEEKKDPFNVKWLVSNDVLTSEMEYLAAETSRVAASLQTLRSVASGSGGGGYSKSEVAGRMEELELEEGELQSRQFLVDSMLAVLQHQVQTGALSLEAYLDRVRARLERDQRLAVFCSQQGDKSGAVRVLRRVKAMQAEIQGAEQALAEAEDSEDSDVD